MEENELELNLTEKKNYKELIPWLLIMVQIVVIAFCIYYFGINGWVQDGDGLSYYVHGQKLSGVQMINVEGTSHTYIFDKSGTMKLGWISYNGNYYYQDKMNGIYVGDCVVDGTLYHFEDDGVFHVGLYMQDGVTYIRNEHGFAGEGLVSSGGHIYYSNDLGQIVSGWIYINKKKHYFDKVTGQMLVDGVYIIDGVGYALIAMVL